LSAKHVHSLLLSDGGKQLTYQAVHKVVRRLASEGVLERNFSSNYRLSLDWISRSKKFLQEAEVRHVSPDRISFADIAPDSSTTVEFNESLAAPFYWVLSEMAEYTLKHRVEGDVFIVMYGAWPVFIVSKKEYDEIRQLTSSARTRLVCTTNFFLDRFTLEFWKRGFGTPYVMGTDPANKVDSVVFGDFIVQIYTPPEVMAWFSKNMIKKIMDLNSLYKICFQKKFKIKLVITRNAALAREMRRKLATHFKTGGKRSG
jgi:hypothetical protein